MTSDSPIYASQIERDLLRALCAGRIDTDDWKRLIGRLEPHAWTDPEHEVVYDALRAVPSDDARTRHAELPAQATRMGFPDVDWAKYFDAEELDGVNPDALIDRLESADSQ